MPKNYRADTPGVPFIRTREIRITYQETGDAQVTCTEQEAVCLADGTVRGLGDAGYLEFAVHRNAMTTTVPLVNPTTGEPIGQTVALQNVMLGIASVIRAQQLARDQANAYS